MTDTTQPRHAIERLLADIGADGLFDDLYVSSSCRARKDTGTMWDLVEIVEEIPRHRWLHIGDNEFSDLQQAADRGISWFSTPRPGAHGPPRVRLRMPPDGVGAGLVAGQALASGASGPARTDTADPSAVDIGYQVIGPLVLTFVTWAVETARERGIEHLLFASRDGYLAHRVFDMIVPFLPDESPTADDLFVSRRVAIGAIQGTEAGLRHLIDAAAYEGSVRRLLDARAGIDLSGRGIDELLDTVVDLPDDADRLYERLVDHLDLMVESGAAQHGALSAYFDTLGLTAQRRVGLVDLGYSATAQRALEAGFPLDIVGLYACTTERADASGDRVESCFGRGSVLGAGNLVYDNAMAFEALSGAPLPQATRFDLTRSRLSLASDPQTVPSDEVTEYAEIARRAALQFVADAIERFGPELVTSRIDPDTVHRAIADAHGTLLPHLRRVMPTLSIDDRFCGRGDVAISTGVLASPPA